MGQLVEVLAVTVGDVAPDGPLLGANVDEPTAGRKVSARALEIGGWVLGSAAQPDEIEVVLGGAVVARAPVRHARQDIAAAFPGVAGAAGAGFDVAVDASSAPAEGVLEVRARFGAAAVPIGSLRVRRIWRGAPAAGERPLVSVVVCCDDDGQDLDATLRAVGAQRHWPTEMVIVGRSPFAEESLAAWRERGFRCVQAPDDGAAALRNEGIRHSSGQLIAFVGAGRTLAAGALERSVEIFAGRPEAAGLVDGTADGVVGAVYRRSAFEELEGFRDGPASPCDDELAERAAAGYDVLLEPGVLIAARGA